MIEAIARFICRHFHRGVYLPVHGSYRCKECLRQWPVPWEEQPRKEEPVVDALVVRA